MSTKPLYSADIVDALIRDLLRTKPEALADFAYPDEQVRLRRLPGAPTIDPLDGLDVMGRHIIAVALALRSHRGAVTLASEHQARDAGWPSARVANVAIILGWALFTATEPAAALPLLLEPDEKATRNRFLRIKADAPIDKLLTAFYRWRRSRPGRADSSEPARSSVRRTRQRRLASPDTLLGDLLGIDAASVEIQSDSWYPEPKGRSARAVHVWAVIALELLELRRVMEREGVKAVRLKTAADAALAGLSHARAANLALLLAASLFHGGSGYTVTFLPADDRLATDLVEASRRIKHRSGDEGDLRADVVDILDLEDMARRDYVHVGRLAAERVANRLFDAGRLG